NSQRAGELMQLSTINLQPSTYKVWDCCAASGGKSILVKDVSGNIDLTVSDIRESILYNLKKRFDEAGIKNYNSFLADLSTVNCQLPATNFDLIIADVPCSGSGTWSRTPEQLYFFNNSAIGQYSQLQKKIITNVVLKLKPGGHLLYITCSVFKRENEELVNFIREKFHLQLIKQEVLKGYDKKADTMFAALLQKPL
ncbi:MAG: methyltransferase domain-containing protein, partial [Sphingobacteriales bacterium]